MRVSGVLSYNCETRLKRNNNKDYGINIFICKNFDRRKDLFKKSTPSFTAITTHGQLRYLTHDHLIRCIYCKKGMIYTGDISAMQKEGVFSGEVKTFVERVKPFRKRLKGVNRLIFDKVEKYSKKAPQTTLSTIIQNLYNNSIKKLRKVQTKVINELYNEAQKLHPDTQELFEKYIGLHNDRLYEIPHIEEFHGKTFKYKMNKFSQSLHNEELQKYVTRIISNLDDPIFKYDTAFLPDDIVKTISSRFVGKHLNVKDAKIYIINRLMRIGERFGRQDIVELCKTSEKMVKGEKVKIKFSNKELMHDLVEHVLFNERKSNIYYKMIEIAKKLPTSLSNIDSFIVKWRYANSDTIGYKILDASSATVEHVKPTSEGGEDILTNWVLACKVDNNGRMSTPQYKFLRRFPPRNPQAFFNDIIEIANNEGTFTRNEVEGMAQSIKDEGHVTINLKRLKCE